jgi:hypothetical protein
MPYMKNGKRDYKREYEEYHADDKQKKNRAKRNSARRELEKEGVVRKNDNKDVDHKRPLSKGGGNSRSNLRAIDASKNRSFARTRNGKMK